MLLLSRGRMICLNSIFHVLVYGLFVMISNCKCQHSACNTLSTDAVQRPAQVPSPDPNPSMQCSATGETNVTVAHVAQRACADVQDAETEAVQGVSLEIIGEKRLRGFSTTLFFSPALWLVTELNPYL